MRILVGGLVGAAVLGTAGFLWGAKTPDENAGQAAILVATVGAVAGFVLGGVIAYFCGR